jgi:DnaJ-class molecular chaperone
MGTRDPKGFYAALNVGPASSQMEIRLAYKFLKSAYRDGKRFTNIGKVRSAYVTLSDPKLRAQYDGHASADVPKQKRDPSRSRIDSIPMLIGTGLMFAAAFALSTGVLSNWVTFRVGDDLVWKQTSKSLGQVIEVDQAHEFLEAPTQEAYKIQTKSGIALWFPADELHRGAKAK